MHLIIWIDVNRSLVGQAENQTSNPNMNMMNAEMSVGTLYGLSIKV